MSVKTDLNGASSCALSRAKFGWKRSEQLKVRINRMFRDETWEKEKSVGEADDASGEWHGPH